jgi:hypothetical protein
MPCAIADGRAAGGQYFVQLPAAVQVIVPFFSEARTYSVRPSPLTSTVPSPGTRAACTVTEATVAAELVVGGAVVVADPAAAALEAGLIDALLDVPQAANTRDAPAKARIGALLARHVLG